ncbi:MAG: DUF3052 domain-containing protein [Propionibacteriaceae bacterium]
MTVEKERAESMGMTKGLIVQELGWDSDVDETLRDDIMDAIDADMVEEADDAVDVVLLWWRDGDGDVADGLVDAMTDLSQTGCIWMLTPKVGKPGHIDPSDIAEGSLTAGFAQTKQMNVASDWQATKLVRPKGVRK